MRLQVPVAGGLALVALLAGCGGGGSSSSGSPSGSGSALTITTNSPLPGTLMGHPYSASLAAANGRAPLTWSIAPVAPTVNFVDGLSIDPSTGVLSGTANFGGTVGFTAKVTDSSSPPQTATKSFDVTASPPLQAPAPQASTINQFQNITFRAPAFQGGVFPFTFSLAGPLPPGLRFDRSTGQISGSPITTGNYASTIAIQDSFSPPEVVSQQLTITVIPPFLSVANSLPLQIPKNRPFSGRVVATGGNPPYHFALQSGSVLPPGLNPIDPNSGQISGTPTTTGTFPFFVSASDSSSPPQNAAGDFQVTVAEPHGRNDTIANATPIGDGAIGVDATISPYIDPPDNAPLAADSDYYKVVSLPGSSLPVELQTRADSGSPIDTVLEIVDGNGIRYSTCRQPGDTRPDFTSACINDDNVSIIGFTLDSALEFKVPGTPNSATTFYVHVLDWRGDARPDMGYELLVQGTVPPLSITATTLVPATRGLSYSQALSSLNGIGTVLWSKAGGNLPPGIVLARTEPSPEFPPPTAHTRSPPRQLTRATLLRQQLPRRSFRSPNWSRSSALQPCRSRALTNPIPSLRRSPEVLRPSTGTSTTITGCLLLP